MAHSHDLPRPRENVSVTTLARPLRDEDAPLGGGRHGAVHWSGGGWRTRDDMQACRAARPRCERVRRTALRTAPRFPETPFSARVCKHFLQRF